MQEPVTVFRSADENARDDAAGVAELLKSQGIEALLLDDRAPGVPEGVWEVRVEAAEASRAETLLAESREPPDESHDLDLVTVFRSGDGSSEGDMEALTVKNLLDAAGFDAVLVGAKVPFPNLTQEVRVPRENADEARQIIQEARAHGAAAADEAEAESESGS